MIVKKRSSEVEIPSSSLADIAFLLLIFFLVATTIDVDKGLNLVLPEMGSEIEIQKKNITNLLINDVGQILLDNEEVSIEEVDDVIRDKLLANDKLIISVKTDRKTKYNIYIKVLDQLKKAGATRISIAEPEEA